MVVETHITSARDRARAERETVRKRRTAFEQFVARVEGLSPETVRSQRQVTALTTGGSRLSGGSGRMDDRCRQVRTAFEETVYPHSVDDRDDALLETIRSELSDSIAMALAPTTGPFRIAIISLYCALDNSRSSVSSTRSSSTEAGCTLRFRTV